MDRQEDFLQTIHDLQELAATRGGRLSTEEIRGAFPGMELTKEHLGFISSYLTGYHIEVEDSAPDQDRWEPESMADDPKDEKLAEIYLRESAGSGRLSEKETGDLLDRMAAGQEEARDRLIEAHLALAAEMAGDYKNRGLLYSDLIQESNLGLMLAVSEYEPGMEEGFDHYVRRRIRQQIEEALQEYNLSTRSSVKLAEQINRLNEISSAFAREHEREAQLDELAERMGIPEEEVRTLMKISLDAVNLLEQ